MSLAGFSGWLLANGFTRASGWVLDLIIWRNRREKKRRGHA